MTIRIRTTIVFVVAALLLSTCAGFAMTSEEFISKLQESEEQLQIITMTARNTHLYNETWHWPKDLPRVEGTFTVMPYQGKSSSTGFRRIPDDDSPSRVVSPDKVKIEPFEVRCDGTRIRSFSAEKMNGWVSSDTMRTRDVGTLLPTDFLGWTMAFWRDTPLHKVLKNEFVPFLNKYDHDVHVEIEKISPAPESGDGVILVEIAVTFIYPHEDGVPDVPFPATKIDIWFDMNRSVRPIRMEEHKDTTGQLTAVCENIELQEVEPGIWMPVKGDLTKYRSKELKNIDSNWDWTRPRDQRWASYEITYPDPPHFLKTRMDAVVSVNQPAASDQFAMNFPKGAEVFDVDLKESRIQQ